MSFINFSNHNSEKWNEKQKEASMKWGTIKDVPFPAVPAEASEDDIHKLANEYVEKICAMDPGAVMCQGEFTLTYAVVNLLKEKGITVVSACSERVAVETVLPDGTSQKSSIFEFVKFRKY